MTPKSQTSPNTATDLRRIDLEELMNGGRKVILQHGQRPYCLTITRKGNLILTAANEQQESTPHYATA